MKSFLLLLNSLFVSASLSANHSLWEGLGLEFSNQLRLELYADLLGQLRPDHSELQLGFGSLGSFQLYPTHCLLKTANGQCLMVDRYQAQGAEQAALNQALNELLEQIDLMAQAEVDAGKRLYVDRALAGLAIGAFEKLYVRHLLLRYGRWDRARQSVWLHSDWLSKTALPPLALQLQPREVRGFFLNHGGQVYVNTRSKANGAAFELFLYQLMSREVRYVESKPKQEAPPTAAISPLYGPYSWIPLVLGQLRAHGINVGDPDVICHFRNHPDFSRLYAQMTEEERARCER